MFDEGHQKCRSAKNCYNQKYGHEEIWVNKDIQFYIKPEKNSWISLSTFKIIKFWLFLVWLFLGNQPFKMKWPIAYIVYKPELNQGHANI